MHLRIHDLLAFNLWLKFSCFQSTRSNTTSVVSKDIPISSWKTSSLWSPGHQDIYTIASNKATIQNNYTVQENPGFSSMNLHAWHVFKEVSIFSMCFHVFRFLSMCSKSHRLINASSWCVQSISICKGCGLLGLASSQMDFFCFGEKITGSNLEQTWGRKQSPSQNLETFPRKHSPSMGSPLQSLGFRLKHCRQ